MELTNKQANEAWATIIAVKVIIFFFMMAVFCSCTSSVAGPQIKQAASATGTTTGTAINAISTAADVINRSNLATAVAVQAFRIETRNIIAQYRAETETELIVRLKHGDLASELFAFRKDRQRHIMQVATQRRLALQAVTMQFQLVQ